MIQNYFATLRKEEKTKTMKKTILLYLVVLLCLVACNRAYFNVATQTITVKGVSFKMIAVAGGTFNMGAQSTSIITGANYDSDARSSESPVHQVTLSSYSIGETEVTQALWYAVMGYKPVSDTYYKWCTTYGVGDNYPAYFVSYDDITVFITKLNQLTGKTFRLPTEAEWEYAARGGSKSKSYKYAGSNIIGDVAWYDDSSSPLDTSSYPYVAHTVKTKKSNELGIYDMSGNLLECCSDWYGSYNITAQTNPTGATTGYNRVYRGGSCVDSADGCRVSYRNYCSPSIGTNGTGFRLVLVS